MLQEWISRHRGPINLSILDFKWTSDNIKDIANTYKSIHIGF